MLADSAKIQSQRICTQQSHAHQRIARLCNHAALIDDGVSYKIVDVVPKNTPYSPVLLDHDTNRCLLCSYIVE